MTVNNERYLACISSNQSAGEQVRRDVAETLAGLHIVPTGFSFPPLTDGYLWKLQQIALDDADFCVLILGSDYGPVSETGVGYLHRAAAHAMATEKPVLVLVCEALSESPSKVDHLRYMNMLHDLRKQARVIDAVHPTDIRDLLEKAVEELVEGGRLRGWQRVGEGSTHTEVKVLQQQIGELREYLDQVRRGDQPKGHGNRPPAVDYRVKVFRDGNMTTHEHALKIGWDGLFELVAPLLTVPKREAEWKAEVEERLLARVQPDLRKSHPKAHGFVALRVDGVVFDQIKQHYRRLGWVTQVDGIWQLTALGEHNWARLENQSSI